jgi:hypothetical protein
MRNTATVEPTPAADTLEHAAWTPRGLAALELAPPPAFEDHAPLLVPKPRDERGRFRSTHGDVAFAAA